MILNDQHKFAFVHIPKSAGTTVRYALLDYDQRRARYFDRARSDIDGLGLIDLHHLPLNLVKRLYPDDFDALGRYRSFALIRDPKSRFASSLHEYLHWNTDNRLADLTAEQRKDVVRTVIAKLEGIAPDEPVSDPSLIHFSRQSDYVELNGERIVSDIYPAENVDQVLQDVAAILGTQIDAKPRNQRKSYRWQGLKTLSELIQRPIQAVLPEPVWLRCSHKVRSLLVNAGLFHFDKDRDFSHLFDEDVERFVKAFYRRDFELRAELIPQSASPAGTKVGARQSDGATKSVCA